MRNSVCKLCYIIIKYLLTIDIGFAVELPEIIENKVFFERCKTNALIFHTLFLRNKIEGQPGIKFAIQ